MKKIIFALVFLALPFGLFAQNLGADYIGIGELDAAREYFESGKGATPAENNYYLGEIAYLKGDLNAARAYYEKGLAADVEYPFNKIGMAKLNMKSDRAAATKEIASLAKAKTVKKNPEALVAIARIYHEAGMTAERDKVLQTAENVGKKSAAANIMRGDMYAADKNYGGAAKEYEQAILKDESSALAHLKFAEIYMRLNPNLAIERLRELEATNPGYPLTSKFLAKAHYSKGEYTRAIALYGPLYEKTSSDLEVITNYAAALFFTGDYDKASELTQKGLAIDSDNFVLNRLRMYSAYEIKNFEDGIAVAEKFFNLPKEDNEYIVRDYLTYGDMLYQSDRLADAMTQYDIALTLPEIKLTEIKQIVDNLSGNNDYAAAAHYYQIYIDRAGDDVAPSDYYNMGLMYYRAANAESRKAEAADKALLAEYLDKAEPAFAKLAELVPDSHLGILYMARVNALRDPETTDGLAKPYYEQLVEFLQGKDDTDRYKRDFLEAYQYLSYYYYLQYEDAGNKPSDKAKTLQFSNKMLELDSKNAIAKQLIEALTQVVEQ